MDPVGNSVRSCYSMSKEYGCSYMREIHCLYSWTIIYMQQFKLNNKVLKGLYLCRMLFKMGLWQSGSAFSILNVDTWSIAVEYLALHTIYLL